jgi:hypothetical protein
MRNFNVPEMRLISIWNFSPPEKKKDSHRVIIRCVTAEEIGLNIFIIIKNFKLEVEKPNNNVTEKVRFV